MRLNNDMRRDILKAAIDFKTKKAEAAYAKARTALADKLYEHEFGKVGRTAARLPRGWLNMESWIAIKHPDFDYAGRHGKPGCRLTMSRGRPFPYFDRCPNVTDKSHPLFSEAQAVAQMHADLEREKDAIRETVNALTFSVQSSERLLEAWPEGKRFIPKEVKTISRALVPVEAAAKANAVLGIAALVPAES
jgi:hypothetical protein